MRTLELTVRGLALLVAGAVATHLPVTPAQLLLVVLLGAAVLLAGLERRTGALARTLAAVHPVAPGVWHADEPRDVTVPPAPGTPGTTLARAPSRRARAVA